MSVKEFFAFANVKQTVIEFLKNKADFETLPDKNKKSFRAHINKHLSNTAYKGTVGTNAPGHLPQESVQNSGPDKDSTSSLYADYFVSDGFHSIKCAFSPICKENFERSYPSSIKIFNIVNMLICVHSYRLELRSKDFSRDHSGIVDFFGSGKAGAQSLSSLEIVLVIEELKVISFDRFSMKMPASVAWDDQVQTHLRYMRHFLTKRSLIGSEFQMAEIAYLPYREALKANEERSTYFPGASSISPIEGRGEMNAENALKMAGMDVSTFVQLKSDTSSKKNGPGSAKKHMKKRDEKKLRKLKPDVKYDDFLSLQGSQVSFIDGLECSQMPNGPKVGSKQTHSQPRQSQRVVMSQASRGNKSQVQSSQVRAKEAADLAEIDDIMDGIMDDEIDEGENKSESVRTQSPTQPALLSQRQQLFDEAAQEADKKPVKNSKCSIEEMLGEKLLNTPQSKKGKFSESQQPSKKEEKSKFEITNNEEKISNSSSPIENEKLLSNYEKKQNKSKIVLDFELTEEMKKQEESIHFGVNATPYSAKSSSVNNVQNGNLQGDQVGIGFAPDSMKNQQDMVKFKAQGKQGAQNSPKTKEVPASQCDLLDMIDDSKKSQSQSQSQQKSQSARTMSANKGRKKAQAVAKGNQSVLDFFIRRLDKKTASTDKKQEVTNSGNKNITTKETSPKKVRDTQNPESDEEIRTGRSKRTSPSKAVSRAKSAKTVSKAQSKDKEVTSKNESPRKRLTAKLPSPTKSPMKDKPTEILGFTEEDQEQGKQSKKASPKKQVKQPAVKLSQRSLAESIENSSGRNTQKCVKSVATKRNSSQQQSQKPSATKSVKILPASKAIGKSTRSSKQVSATASAATPKSRGRPKKA